MEQKQNTPIVVSIAGMPKREQKMVVMRITKDVTADKQFKKTIRKSD
jgi:hypothetical protein